MQRGPSFCWHCGKPLAELRNGRTVFPRRSRVAVSPDAVLVFVLVRDPMGHKHRVHKVCLDDVLSEGNEQVTADQGEGAT